MFVFEIGSTLASCCCVIRSMFPRPFNLPGGNASNKPPDAETSISLETQCIKSAGMNLKEYLSNPSIPLANSESEVPSSSIIPLPSTLAQRYTSEIQPGTR